MIFQTTYSEKLKTPPEINSGETLVEKAGYVSSQKRIESMILAGQRLVELRKAQYDFPQGMEIDETFHDPTRNLNFDLADASQLQIQTEASLKASQTAQEAQQVPSEAKSEPIPE